MLLTEEFNMFVAEPIFERMFHLHPLIPPILFVCAVFIPVAYIMIKSAYFTSHYDN